ncbi:MAG: chemotaxis response regulator protein-glutamate methylesterase [Succinatimonas sp.]|jgi:two-component system chemotaxis response regulator CheB|nr:chemotaxis response regulator protein-glutamate methylesterase [Succinatimonas sp.]MDD5868198.1 chemotaxis response regulator protein-glutamate methylesterase [Succinatimonas sp.]MDY5722164.1 chemotaxis response regulator protein-glutamate methylesterase [Succinivibrio sp.]
MATKILIVDDSSFFRKRLKEIFESDPSMQVVGEAKDGKEGVAMTEKLRPDVITMDVEMPVMDGITAVKEIMAKCPTPILMFSSLTFEGANSTFKALEAGAIDFMPKNFDDIAHRREDAIKSLIGSVKAVSRSRVRGFRPAPATTATARPATSTLSARPSATTSTLRTTSTSTLASRTSTLSSTRTSSFSSATSATPAATSGAAMGQYKKINEMLSGDPGIPAAARKFTFGDHKAETTAFRKSGKLHSIVAIGSSTGGPIALQQIIPKLPKLNVPVIVVQHMPGSFTQTFAQRLDAQSQLHVVEAKDGDMLEPGTCYIAPGGKQMIFEKVGVKTRVRIIQDTGRLSYNPCVDVSFASLCQIYGGKVLAMILTGMGSDGCEGCQLLKKKGSVIWAQNEETCVVYGMPQAIVNASVADMVLPLQDIASCIVKELG